MYDDLPTWWVNGSGRNAWTRVRTSTGELEVYVRRLAIDPSVMMIANISTISGHGGVRALYRTITRDIPAIAELVLNPELDKLLVRLGWDHAYYDDAGTPTRVNKEFQKRFPAYGEARSPAQAVVLSR